MGGPWPGAAAYFLRRGLRFVLGNTAAAEPVCQMAHQSRSSGCTGPAQSQGIKRERMAEVGEEAQRHVHVVIQAVNAAYDTGDSDDSRVHIRIFSQLFIQESQDDEDDGYRIDGV